MDVLTVPPAVREKVGDLGSDGLVMMFADAHRIGMDKVDRTVRQMEDRFEHRLNERLSNLRFDLLKWNFLFWIGQLTAMTAILNVMLRGTR
ncbi:MAG TPA: hypothetical protein VIK60_06300 [Vicinamibacterales bacterium]